MVGHSSTARNVIRIGLIVNPIAGAGGPAGLKGTDEGGALAAARKRGVEPVAGLRGLKALLELAKISAPVEIVTCRGAMGEDAVRSAGLLPRVLQVPEDLRETTADDTRKAATLMKGHIDLMLFVGGDGTARDIHEVFGNSVAMLGVPAGVKMHSGVFAITPSRAGQLVAAAVSNPGSVREREAEIVDLDEAELRRGHSSPRLFGYARTFHSPMHVRGAKAYGQPGDEAEMVALASEFGASMEGGRVYLFGPGRTTQRVMEGLRLEGTLLGVDAVADGKLLGKDLSAAELLALTDGRAAAIVVGVIGGQGYLFGRGNQQIGAPLIRRAGRQNIHVLSLMEKLTSLDPKALFVDTGDEELDRELSGYIRVRVGPMRFLTMPVRS